MTSDYKRLRNYWAQFLKQEQENCMRSQLFNNNALILKSESFILNNPTLCGSKAAIRRENANFSQHPLFYMGMKLGLPL
jgi:hypothetical protein